MDNAAEKQEVAQPYATELVELNRVEAALAELRAKYGTVPDFTNKTGYEKGKKGIRELTSYRTSTDKLRLSITEPHRKFIDRVNSYGKDLIGKIEAIEKPLKAAKKEVDEAEKRKAEERIARLQERLAKEVTSFLDTAVGLDSNGLADLIEAAEAVDVEGYFDITKEAEDERARVIRELTNMHAATLERERLAAEQEELEAQRRKMQEEAERRAAEQKELEELRRFKAEQEAAKASQDAERERIRQEEEAKAKAEAERKAREEGPAPAENEPAIQSHSPSAGEPGYRKPLDTSRITQAADNFKRGSDIARPDTVEITRKEYDRLLVAEAKLDALEAAGVDNWAGYDDAMAHLEAA